MRSSAPRDQPPGGPRFRRLRLHVGQGALVLLVLFLLFEVGIRHVPPDGMTVTEVGYPGAQPTFAYSFTAPKDQQTIDDIYASFNRAPVWSAWDHHGCVMTQDPPSVVFTWHGVPVESWTLAACWYVESAGGISDGLIDQHLLPDKSVPPPPPIGGIGSARGV